MPKPAARQAFFSPASGNFPGPEEAEGGPLSVVLGLLSLVALEGERPTFESVDGFPRLGTARGETVQSLEKTPAQLPISGKAKGRHPQISQITPIGICEIMWMVFLSAFAVCSGGLRPPTARMARRYSRAADAAPSALLFLSLLFLFTFSPESFRLP